MAIGSSAFSISLPWRCGPINVNGGRRVGECLCECKYVTQSGDVSPLRGWASEYGGVTGSVNKRMNKNGYIQMTPGTHSVAATYGLRYTSLSTEVSDW